MTLVALIVTFIGSNSERVSIVLPNDHPAEQVQDALLRTQDRWVSIPAVVDGFFAMLSAGTVLPIL